MKRILSILFLGSNLITFAQLQVYTLSVTTNDLVYDKVTNKIYASIPSSNGSNGNSLGVINPSTHLLEKTIFIGSEPTVLAISDNGQYIYSGFSGASTIRKFDVASQTALTQFSLGTSTYDGAYYAEDIEVMPGQPNTIAVSRKNVGYSPRHEGVGIYDNGVVRPTTTPGHTGSNKIEFVDQNSLVGYNNETTEYGIRKLSVNTDGVTNVSVAESVLSNFSVDFIYKDNVMYSTSGKAVDITGSPFVSGQFTNVNGPVAYDSYYNRVCFASTDSYGGNVTFKRFDPNTFLISDSLPISQVGPAKSIITCGNGCYAFNTDTKVFIIKDSKLGLPEIGMKNNLAIYPNPTSDFLNIKSDIEINDIQIMDINGRAINKVALSDGQIYLGNLENGIYFAKITDANGDTAIEKIIKQ